MWLYSTHINLCLPGERIFLDLRQLCKGTVPKVAHSPSYARRNPETGSVWNFQHPRHFAGSGLLTVVLGYCRTDRSLALYVPTNRQRCCRRHEVMTALLFLSIMEGS